MRRMAVLVVGWAVALGCSGAEGDSNPGGAGGDIGVVFGCAQPVPE